MTGQIHSHYYGFAVFTGLLNKPTHKAKVLASTAHFVVAIENTINSWSQMFHISWQQKIWLSRWNKSLTRRSCVIYVSTCVIYLPGYVGQNVNEFRYGQCR